jgi:hypothetical protein
MAAEFNCGTEWDAIQSAGGTRTLTYSRGMMERSPQSQAIVGALSLVRGAAVWMESRFCSRSLGVMEL